MQELLKVQTEAAAAAQAIEFHTKDGNHKSLNRVKSRLATLETALKHFREAQARAVSQQHGTKDSLPF